MGTAENAILSNLSYRPFTFGGRTYYSVEHAYQTLKSGQFDQTVYDAYQKAFKATELKEGELPLEQRKKLWRANQNSRKALTKAMASQITDL